MAKDDYAEHDEKYKVAVRAAHAAKVVAYTPWRLTWRVVGGVLKAPQRIKYRGTSKD